MRAIEVRMFGGPEVLVPTDLEPPVPPRVIRQAQGKLTPQGEIVDPLLDGETIDSERAAHR